MSKKTEEKLEIKEIKTYQTSDGKIYDTEEAALEHERLLKNPEEWYKIKILELEAEISGLRITIERLESKISLLEDRNKFFPQQPIVKYPDLQPLPAEPGQVKWTYFGEKHPDCAPIQDGHADVGPSYTVYNPVEISKMSDEELIKKGYQVAYVGDKRAVCPPITQFDFDKVKGNNITIPPEYFGNPCDNQEYNAGHTGLGYGEMEKRRMEWQEKNKK